MLKPNTEFYAEWDEETGTYCVFDTEDGKAWSNWASLRQAEKDAEEREQRLKEVFRRELTMTAEQVKIYMSKYVIPQCNKGNEAILRDLIFSLSDDVFEQAGAIIIHEHPELTQEFIDNNCVAK